MGSNPARIWKRGRRNLIRLSKQQQRNYVSVDYGWIWDYGWLRGITGLHDYKQASHNQHSEHLITQAVLRKGRGCDAAG